MGVENNRRLTWEEAVKYLLSQPEQQNLVKACYYDAPLLNAVDRYWCSEEWHAIKELIPSSAGVALDIGAGNGIASYALAKEGWQVCALEPDPSDMVGVGAIRKLAKTTELPIRAVQEVGECLPFPDQSFDLVFARQVLHHAHDLHQLCKEVNRVLKPGGTFVAVRDHVISSIDDLPQFLESHPLHKLYGGENAFLLDEYTAAIKSSGFLLRKVLQPLESVINYAPKTKSELKLAIRNKLKHLPLPTKISDLLLNNDHIYTFLLNLAEKFDHRPGRLYSFMAYKVKE